MIMHRRSNISVDNLARAQRTMVSTAEPGTPLMLRGRLRGNQPPNEHKNSSLSNLMVSTLTPLSRCPKDGDHLRFPFLFS